MPFPVIERWYDGPFNICCKDYEKTLNISLSPDKQLYMPNIQKNI